MSLNVTILKETFAKIRLRPLVFTSSFYNNLFNDYPEIRTLFALTSMKKQREHLMQSLELVIDNLDRPDVVEDALKSLGARHVNFGTVPTDYSLVGLSLLKTLESLLGNDWTPEVKQAWTDAYQAIASIMLEGALFDSSLESSHH